MNSNNIARKLDHDIISTADLSHPCKSCPAAKKVLFLIKTANKSLLTEEILWQNKKK
jgi:hypothetical protein